MTFRAMLAATAMVAALAGCEQIGSFTEQPVQAAQEPQFFENAYAARSAGKFSLPPIPEEEIPVAYRRQIVPYETTEQPGTIVIDPAHAVLYLVQPEGKAIRYGISVGRDGFGWSGTSVVARKAQWPTWTPPAEMIERQPSLEKWRDGQPGGPTNPLGARALYLYIDGKDYGFRIHGTPEWRTIGKRASSGCFRMIQQDVLDLYERVPTGTKVVVLTPEGEIPTKLTLPPPSPKPKRAAPVAASAAPAKVETKALDAETTDVPDEVEAESADTLARDAARALEAAPAATPEAEAPAASFKPEVEAVAGTEIERGTETETEAPATAPAAPATDEAEAEEEAPANPVFVTPVR
ncbi:L,D-transpeptidase [Falsirhodobacter deserti]|uniref:L,D-transpeptidase n=1 Tax=Falsirhodobacter deserti TaxID=1365611 RepID=UPI000FE3BDD4|nr:L,D-transpeptidase [Falsirhodobacter deserti]